MEEEGRLCLRLPESLSRDCAALPSCECFARQPWCLVAQQMPKLTPLPPFQSPVLVHKLTAGQLQISRVRLCHFPIILSDVSDLGSTWPHTCNQRELNRHIRPWFDLAALRPDQASHQIDKSCWELVLWLSSASCCGARRDQGHDHEDAACGLKQLCPLQDLLSVSGMEAPCTIG